MRYKTLDIVIAILLIIGGVNWGLVGIFGFNLINSLFGSATVFSRIIYILVGLSAFYEIFQWRKMHCRLCQP